MMITNIFRYKIKPHSAASVARELDRLELTCLAYLLLPIAILTLGWLRWPIAIALFLLLTFSTFSIVKNQKSSVQPLLTHHAWMMIIFVAALWVSLSGIGGYFLLNPDWSVRMSVLHDLAVMPWPVTYTQADGQVFLLRPPLGYYMVPAFIGKLGGMDAARFAQWVWTVIGVTLFMGLTTISTPGRSPHGGWLPLLVVIGFSGMDVIGSWLSMGSWPEFGEHVEWWARLFQYSSNTTMLFWVPNHAIPGWLGALIIWRHREHGLAIAPAALLLLCIVAWAPLVAIGIMPFLLLICLHKTNLSAFLKNLVNPIVLAIIPTGLLITKFLTFGIPASPQAIPGPGLFQPFVSEMINFALLEWCTLTALLIIAGQRSKILWLAAIILAALPFIKFGPGNDIVMRASIPSLTFLMLFSLDALTKKTMGTKQKIQKTLITIVIFIGAGTALQEIERSLMLSGHPEQTNTQNLVQQHGTPWHYVGKVTDEWMFWFFAISK